jgi:hypothetical protein
MIAAFFIMSCDDYLDIVPDNVATIDNAFVDAYAAESYLFTCYKYMPDCADWSNNPALVGSANLWLPPYEGMTTAKISETPVQFQRGIQSKNKPYYDYWGGSGGGKDLYEGIRHCNVMIERISDVRDMTEVEKLRYIAEANFMKAYYHFYLVRMYGPIPIVDENLDVSSTTDDVKIERQNIEVCFDYILKTLDKSIPDLPDYIDEEFEGTQLGRATKAIAKALKAKIMVTSASPFFNGNTMSMLSKDGEELLATVYQKSKWNKAAEACRIAVEFAESVGNELFYFDSYQNLNDTTKARMNIRGAFANEWNKELIWGNTRDMYAHQIQLPPNWVGESGWHTAMRQMVNPTINAAELFYSKNGVPIENDNSLNFVNKYSLTTVDDEHKWHMKKGSKQPVLHMNRETRFYACLAFDNSVWFGNGKTDDTNPRVMSLLGNDAANGGVMVTGYLLKKNVYYKNTYEKGNKYSIRNIPFPEIRLGDLYLLYAEALNETLDAPNDEVYKYVNLVRSRASLPSVQDAWDNYSKTPDQYKNQEGMRQIIRHERRIELFAEGQSYWDLKRWSIAKEVLNTTILGWSADQETEEDYFKVRILWNKEFLQKNYLWPINEDYIVKNPRIVQNYGW